MIAKCGSPAPDVAGGGAASTISCFHTAVADLVASFDAITGATATGATIGRVLQPRLADGHSSDVVRGLVQGGGELPNHMKGYDLGDWVTRGAMHSVAGVGATGADAVADPLSLAGLTVEQLIDAARPARAHAHACAAGERAVPWAAAGVAVRGISVAGGPSGLGP